MKLLLLISLVATALFSEAQHPAGLVEHNANSAMSMSCMIMVPLIGLLIAGLTYFLVVNNKPRGRGENGNSEKDG